MHKSWLIYSIVHRSQAWQYSVLLDSSHSVINTKWLFIIALDSPLILSNANLIYVRQLQLDIFGVTIAAGKSFKFSFDRIILNVIHVLILVIIEQKMPSLNLSV